MIKGNDHSPQPVLDHQQPLSQGTREPWSTPTLRVLAMSETTAKTNTPKEGDFYGPS